MVTSFQHNFASGRIFWWFNLAPCLEGGNSVREVQFRNNEAILETIYSLNTLQSANSLHSFLPLFLFSFFVRFLKCLEILLVFLTLAKFAASSPPPSSAWSIWMTWAGSSPEIGFGSSGLACTPKCSSSSGSQKPVENSFHPGKLCLVGRVVVVVGLVDVVGWVVVVVVVVSRSTNFGWKTDLSTQAKVVLRVRWRPRQADTERVSGSAVKLQEREIKWNWGITNKLIQINWWVKKNLQAR